MTKLADLGGYPDQWPVGSIFANEGKRLYDLVREYKPKVIVEVGTRFGCSANYLALGCRGNGFGKVYTLDNDTETKRDFKPDLQPFIVQILDDALTDQGRSKVPENIDMLFEDGAHTHNFTRSIFKNYQAPLMVCHDYSHWDCQNTVKREADEVMGRPADESYLEAPSDCGLGIWVLTKPKTTLPRTWLAK